MKIDRREFLEWLTLAGISTLALPYKIFAATKEYGSKQLVKQVPSSGVKIPVIGLGTWVTFNVGGISTLRENRTDLLKEFFKLGGGMIDSSPMYGSSEEVVGYGLKKLNYPRTLFSATKVWTSSSEEGREQIKNSFKLWGLKSFDLIQVHNLLGLENQLKTLFELKEKGSIKHVGVTTSHGRRHSELAEVMGRYPLDFVQLTYNIVDREAESRLLDLAQERRIAVIANRPFKGGELFARVRGKTLPPWSREIDCENWAQFFLKFIVSHPAIICAIPATSKIEHLRENMGACMGKLPDSTMRKRMIQYMSTL